MKAGLLKSINSFQVSDIPKPERKHGEILIKVLACGICGSDRHFIKGEFPTKPPVVLGHEFGGIIEEVGSDSHYKVGSKVTVDPNIFCGKCEFCGNGQVSFCINLSALGVHRDGGMSKFVSVPESQIYVLPDTVPDNHLAFCEPISCCLRGLDLARIEVGNTVLIIGGGAIGLIMIQLAKLSGAKVIILSTRQKERRELALKLGATHTIDPNSVSLDEAINGTGGLSIDGVDVVLECAGTIKTFEDSISVVKRGGTVIVFGVTPEGETAKISPLTIMNKEIRIQGSWINPFTHGRAAAIVASGVLDLDSLISKVISIDDLPEIFANPPGKGDIKYIVNPNL